MLQNSQRNYTPIPCYKRESKNASGLRPYLEPQFWVCLPYTLLLTVLNSQMFLRRPVDIFCSFCQCPGNFFMPSPCSVIQFINSHISDRFYNSWLETRTIFLQEFSSLLPYFRVQFLLQYFLKTISLFSQSSLARKKNMRLLLDCLLFAD